MSIPKIAVITSSTIAAGFFGFFVDWREPF